MNISARFDKFITFLIIATLLYSIALLTNTYFTEESIAAWVWDRHQNSFSWYSRPLFLIPACYYAYRRKLGFVIGLMAMLFCSLFWFSAPESVPVHVSGYLEWEKQLFFSNESMTPLFLMVVVVTLFLFGLFSAFWYRSFWLGLILINTGTLMKIVFSLSLGREIGRAAIIPSLSSLAFINLVAFLIWRYFGIKKKN